MKIIRSYPFLFFLAAAMTVAVYFSLATPVVGNFGDVVTFKMNGTANSIPVLLKLDRSAFDTLGGPHIIATDRYGTRQVVRIASKSQIEEAGVKPGSSFVAQVEYIPAERTYVLGPIERVDPVMTFDFIPGLGELGRNMLFHVPMSMTAFLAFLIGTIYSILYLIKKRPGYDRSARAASAAGLLFTLLATITGSIWARFSWGTFWNWDPREVSIFVLLLIYVAYFILRSLLEESEEKKARIAAVYNIVAFVSVPFLMFVIPRIKQSLHPGGGGGEAPIINTSSTPVHTDPALLNMHWIMVLLFVLLFLWMKDLFARVLAMEETTEN